MLCVIMKVELCPILYLLQKKENVNTINIINLKYSQYFHFILFNLTQFILLSILRIDLFVLLAPFFVFCFSFILFKNFQSSEAFLNANFDCFFFLEIFANQLLRVICFNLGWEVIVSMIVEFLENFFKHDFLSFFWRMLGQKPLCWSSVLNRLSMYPHIFY